MAKRSSLPPLKSRDRSRSAQPAPAPRAARIVLTAFANHQVVSLPQFVTPAEAGALLRLGRGAIYALLNNGTLPARRLGRQFRISREALVSFMVTP